MEPHVLLSTRERTCPGFKELAQRNGAPEKAPRAESKPQTETSPGSTHLVPPSLEWLPSGRDKSLRPDDG